MTEWLGHVPAVGEEIERDGISIKVLAANQSARGSGAGRESDDALPMSNEHKSRHRAGFVAILGRPNAGKSTLLNALLGTKLAIVASKPQTTRTSIQGVLTLPEAQIVFVDTPGIHKSDTLLNKRMMDAVRAGGGGPDVVAVRGGCAGAASPTKTRRPWIW